MSFEKLFEIFGDTYEFWKWIDFFKRFIDDSILILRLFVQFGSNIVSGFA